jgi:hypothetical protein
MSHVIHLSYICHTFVIQFLWISLTLMLDQYWICWICWHHVTDNVGCHATHRTLPGQGDEAGADLGTIRNGADSQQTQDINEEIRRNPKNRMKYTVIYCIYCIWYYNIYIYIMIIYDIILMIGYASKCFEFFGLVGWLRMILWCIVDSCDCVTCCLCWKGSTKALCEDKPARQQEIVLMTLEPQPPAPFEF